MSISLFEWELYVPKVLSTFQFHQNHHQHHAYFSTLNHSGVIEAITSASGINVAGRKSRATVVDDEVDTHATKTRNILEPAGARRRRLNPVRSNAATGGRKTAKLVHGASESETRARSTHCGIILIDGDAVTTLL